MKGEREEGKPKPEGRRIPQGKPKPTKATHTQVAQVLHAISPGFCKALNPDRLKIVYRPKGWSRRGKQTSPLSFHASRGTRKVTLEFNISPKHPSFRREFTRALEAASELQRAMQNEIRTSLPIAIQQ